LLIRMSERRIVFAQTSGNVDDQRKHKKLGLPGSDWE
jgi:hypothetical protein